jgi:Tfp pilus assembly PilM family ATPase
VQEGFAAPGVNDPETLAAVLRTTIRDMGRGTVRRAALSLPDSLFRVQILDFDELPDGRTDRERLVRWRLEKTAAFDAAGTALRYQVIQRQDRGFAVLASVVKSAALSQYEDLLARAGLETWTVGLSSFHALNCYAPEIAAQSIAAYAFVWVTESSYATLIIERGGLRFYRFRDIKPGAPHEVAGKLTRELDDALHFYTHMDRDHRSEIDHVYLAGEPAVIPVLADGLRAATSLETAVLVPAAALPTAGAAAAYLAPVIGAGAAL